MLEEFMIYQRNWEKLRGIHNGNFGSERIQAELDEYREEDDPYKKLVEAADIFIITIGSVGALMEALNLNPEVFDQIVWEKIAKNEQKYPLENWEGRTTEEAIRYSKETWDYLNFKWD